MKAQTRQFKMTSFASPLLFQAITPSNRERMRAYGNYYAQELHAIDKVIKLEVNPKSSKTNYNHPFQHATHLRRNQKLET